VLPETRIARNMATTMTALMFAISLTLVGIAIGMLRLRYALCVGLLAEVGMWWWGQESASGAFADPAVNDPLSLVVALWLGSAILLGVCIRVLRRQPGRVG
jgi:hypothetical protein